MAQLIYVVTSTIDIPQADEFARWMEHHHIPDVLATGCFTAARFARIDTPDEAHQSFTVQYDCPSQSELNRYLHDFAPRLRQDVTERYGDRIVSLRTILQHLASW